MPLTLIQKSAIRRHLQYPTIGLDRTRTGGGAMGLNVGFQYFDAFGRLEFAMNNIPPMDEAALTGFVYGAIGLIGPGPAPGDTVTATLSGGPLVSPISISATAALGDTNTSLALKLGANCAQSSALQAAGIQVLAPYGVGLVSANQSQPLAEISFSCQEAFNLSVSSTGSTGAVVTSPPAVVPPQSTVGKQAGVAIVLNGFIPILNFLEGQLAGASQNLDTRQAGEWKARPDEIRQRKALYREWQGKLSDFLMVPINPLAPGRGGGSGRVRV